MAHRSDESIDQEQFTKLRVELYHATRRLEEQTRMAKSAEFYQQVLGKFIDVISDRSASVETLAKIVGIKTNIRRDFNELKSYIGEQENQRTILGRIEKINMELDVQEELLGLICQTMGQIVRDYDDMKIKMQRISKEHASCNDLGSLANGQLEKLKKIERQIVQKDATILQLKKKNQSIEQQLQKANKKYEETTKKLLFFEKEMDKKNNELQQSRQIVENAQETSKQRQRVLDNCQKLLQIINVPQDDYLKYYFRSSGLQLEPQKQHKNKYSIVFDN